MCDNPIARITRLVTVVVVAVVVVVLTLSTSIIKSVDTGQHVSQLTQFMPPPGTQIVKSGASLRCARSILVHASDYSRRKKPTISLATQGRLPRICYT